MDQIKQPFYCDLYHKTGGFFPTFPENQSLLLGDFFQIQAGKCVPLGNIQDMKFLEPIVYSEPFPLQQDNWFFRNGVQQCFSLMEENHREEGFSQKRSKQTYEFEEIGSHLFVGKEPHERFLLNWSKLKDELTLKMTQEYYGFREVYVVTGVVNVASWGVFLAERSGARLSVSSEAVGAGFFECFFHESARIEECEHIQNSQQRKQSRPSFFQAKKLVMNEKKKDALTRGLYEKQKATGNGKTGPNSFANWLQTDLLNLVTVNELNPSTALEFFDWKDMGLDDLERLE